MHKFAIAPDSLPQAFLFGDSSHGVQKSSVQATDKLVSVTVRKERPDQKAGISLVERNGGGGGGGSSSAVVVYVTNKDPKGLFGDTDITVGDKILSINGKKLKDGQGAKHMIKIINKAKATVTLVVKKGGGNSTSDGIPPATATATTTPSSSRGKMTKKRSVNKLIQQQQQQQDTSLLQSPSTNQGEHELCVGDLITPQKPKRPPNGSTGGGGTHLLTPSQKEKTLDVDVLQPNQSFNVSSLVNIVDDDDDDDDDDNDSDMIDSYQRNQQASSCRTKPLASSGQYSWSHPDQGGNDDNNKSRRGKRPSPSPTPSKTRRTVKSTDTAPKRKIKATPVDDSSESSLEEEVEAAPSTLKKQSSTDKNFHNSWSHPDNNNTNTNNNKSSSSLGKKGKRSTTTPTKLKKTKKKVDNKVKPKINDDPDDESSSSLDGEIEEVAAGIISSPERKAKYISNNASFSASSARIRPEEYGGDYIRVKVKKISEKNPGIELKKTQGLFLLTRIPDDEKRINIGAQVIGINGTMNINTLDKARDLMKQTKEYVTLMIDFSSPIEKLRNCPCCGESMYANGDHVDSYRKGSSQRASGSTHHKPASTRYNVDEYVSDTDYSRSSDDSDKSIDEKVVVEEATLPPERVSTRKFQPGDKFMIRVKKPEKDSDPGITFFDYEGSIYIGKIHGDGPFFSTPIDYGDKLVSMNGQKAEMIKSASNAMNLLEQKEAISLYVSRSGRDSTVFKEAIKRIR
jgi:hypothetical protein